MWFTSDTHYGHSNILEFCKRPFDDVAEMDEKLIAYHNELVKPEDTVYHLGDFAFASHSRISSILNRLNGTYRMLRGNHDKWMKKFKHPKIEWIKDYFEIREEGLVMFHYPLGSWNGMRRGSIMLHGHTHGNYKHSFPNSRNHGKIIDVGVDVHGYQPISISQIREIAENMKFDVTPE